MKRSLTKSIMIISRCTALYRDKYLSEYGLSGYQAPYLPAVCNHPGITQDQIAQELHVNRSSVTRQLTLLEENGYITRKRRETDRRAVEVYPTEKGLAILPTVRESFHSWWQKLTDGLSAEQLELLETLLDTLSRKAEEIG